MKYKVGDKVRVREDLVKRGLYGGEIAVSDMVNMRRMTVTIGDVGERGYGIEEDPYGYTWTDEMFEPVEDELTAEEATKILGEICCENKCYNGCPIGKARGKMSCYFFRRDKPKEVLEILKQWKKDHEKKEVKVQDKMYCRIVDGDGSTVYTESLPDESILNDRMTEILTKFCSEHDSNYFAVCERRWEVVKS